MTVPLWLVAIAFTLVTIFCIIDMVLVRHLRRRLGRFFQAVIYAGAAFYYWVAMANNILPSGELRIVWLAACVTVISEIVSRWGSGGKS
jgi:hypothetical protein